VGGSIIISGVADITHPAIFQEASKFIYVFEQTCYIFKS
jgi:hypothetical protein